MSIFGGINYNKTFISTITRNVFYLTPLILLITVNLDFVSAKLTQEDMPIDQTTGKQIDIDVF